MTDPAVEKRVRDLLQGGDVAAAATETLRSVGPSVLRYLYSTLRDDAAAADAFSQCAENVWRGLPSFRGECSLRTWVLRLAHNAALNHRAEAWRRHTRPFVTGEASRLAEAIRTTTALRLEQQRRELDVLRAALTDEERSLLALRIDQELPWADVASVLSGDGPRVEVPALKKRFERLKDRLSAMAREQGLIE